MPSKQYQNFSFRAQFDPTRPDLLGENLLSSGCTFVWYCWRTEKYETQTCVSGVLRLSRMVPEYWVRKNIERIRDIQGVRGTLPNAMVKIQRSVGSPLQECTFGKCTRQGQRTDLINRSEHIASTKPHREDWREAKKQELMDVKVKVEPKLTIRPMRVRLRRPCGLDICDRSTV